MQGRRAFLKSGALFALIAACNRDALFGFHECAPDAFPIPSPMSSAQRDVCIVSDYTGVQVGTREQPYSASSAAEFDALLGFLRPQDSLAVHLSGRFQTAGVYRWGQFASRNLGPGWTVDGDAEISLAPTIRDSQPIYCLAGPASRVSGVTTIGNHSALVDGWPGSLRTGSVLLDEGGVVEDVPLKNFGALGAESFVIEVAGQGVINRCDFSGYDPSSSDNQVTVRRILGDGLMEGNKTYASGSNWVQAHQIYLSTKATVRDNESVGARFGYYGDYFATKGVEITGNRFTGCEHGVQLNLSQTPLPDALNFSHEDYTIGLNEIESSGANVSLNTWGPSTETRFIRKMAIDASLTVENYGATKVSRASYPDCRMAA